MNTTEFLNSMITSYIIKSAGYDCIKNKFDTKNLDAQKWLNTISIEGYKLSKDWDREDAVWRRGLQKLTKKAKNPRIESGYLLASLFLNVSVVRDKTVTETVEGKELDDFSRNPYDFDYGIAEDRIQEVIEEALEYGEKKIKPQWEICAVASSNEAPPCTACAGEGSVKCDECGGRGERMYVVETYANGSHKESIRKCHHCKGTGKIQCEKCAGSGKQIFANQHQVVKKFEDSKKLRAFACVSTSWENAERCIKRDSTEHKAAVYFDEFKEDAYSRRECPDFGNRELQSGIAKLYKNQKEILVDGEQNIQNEISEICETLYRKNKKAATQYFDKNDKGKPGCSIEKHIAIPMFRLCYTADDGGYNKEYSINIYQFSDKGSCYFNEFDFPKLGFFKSLFI